jgi:hypothetical protein
MVAPARFDITLQSSGSVLSALGTLPEDVNVVPKHVGVTIHN